MRVIGLFWNPNERRPRTLLRIAAQAALSLGLFLLPVRFIADPISAAYKRGAAFPGMSQPSFDHVINMIVGPLLTLAVLISVFVTARLLDRRPISDLGWRPNLRSLEEFGFGFLLGGVLMTIVFLWEAAAGWAKAGPFLQTRVPEVSVVLGFAFTLVKSLCVGPTEESVSRGYLLPNLAEGLGFTRWGRGALLFGAAAISSLAFAGLHMGNPNSTAMSFVGIWLHGMMLATGFILTGGLALPIALHMSWNIFEGAIYGFPVSGDLESASVIRTMAQGPSLLTGAAYGPEAGIVGAAAVLVGIGAIVLYARLRNGSLTPVLSPRWLRPGGAADAPDAPTVAHAASIRSRSEGD